MDEFDEMLISIIDIVMKYSLGQENASMVLEYLAKKSCSLMEIPQNVSLFSLELRKVLDSEESRVSRSRANIQSSAEIIEETILRMLCLRIAKGRIKLVEIGLGELRDATFAEFIIRLKEGFLAKGASQENWEGARCRQLPFVTNGGEDT